MSHKYDTKHQISTFYSKYKNEFPHIKHNLIWTNLKNILTTRNKKLCIHFLFHFFTFKATLFYLQQSCFFCPAKKGEYLLQVFSLCQTNSYM